MTESITYNVLLADDHQMILDGLTSIINSTENFKVHTQASNGQEAITYINSNPDSIHLLITDISMPLLSGIDLCKMIKAQYPQIKVLFLSMYSSNAAVKEAVNAEADGYILKNSGKEELFLAMHRIVNGGTYFTQDILPIIYNQYQKEKEQEKKLSVLTEREREILELIVKENTSEEIAEKLFISKKTVDNHRQNILNKTKSKSTIGMVKYAIKNGIV